MTAKQYQDVNVYEAAKDRLRMVLTQFQRVCVAFSGGKDSSVLLHLALEVSRELGRGEVHAVFIDLEGQYESTIEHVKEMFDRPDVRGWWICLPINLRNASSLQEPYWCAWEPGREQDWIRPMPDHCRVIKDQDYFPFYRYRMEFEDFFPAFNEWMCRDGVSTAILVGIRSDESLNRYLAIKRRAGVKKFAWTAPGDEEPIAWSARDHLHGKAITFFPIYDWRFYDLWRYTADKGNSYNRLYDRMYLAGVLFSQMRVCQPYGDDQRKGLDLFHQLEPQTWFRVVARVAGANCGARYSRQKFLGYRGGMGLPPTFSTWKQYSEFLLRSLPQEVRQVYMRRIKAFIDWWVVRDYPLAAWPDAGTPALENQRAQPSWRRVAMSLLKQDMARSLSFGYAKRDLKELSVTGKRG